MIKVESQDEIYGLDISTEHMWWIRNPSTLHDLDFQGHQAREIKETELKEYKKKYSQGKQINFYADF